MTDKETLQTRMNTNDYPLGTVLKIGKRLWRLVKKPGLYQDSSCWHFDSTESDHSDDIDRKRAFSTSEFEWLLEKGALVGYPLIKPEKEALTPEEVAAIKAAITAAITAAKQSMDTWRELAKLDPDNISGRSTTR